MYCTYVLVIDHITVNVLVTTYGSKFQRTTRRHRSRPAGCYVPEAMHYDDNSLCIQLIS